MSCNEADAARSACLAGKKMAIKIKKIQTEKMFKTLFLKKAFKSLRINSS